MLASTAFDCFRLSLPCGARGVGRVSFEINDLHRSLVDFCGQLKNRMGFGVRAKWGIVAMGKKEPASTSKDMRRAV